MFWRSERGEGHQERPRSGVSRVFGGAEGGALGGVSEAKVGAHKGVHPGGGRELRHNKYTVSEHKTPTVVTVCTIARVQTRACMP